MGPVHNFDDLIDMIRRHFRLMFIIVLVGCIYSFFWALNQPHEYRSAEVLQIEQPKIARDLAPTTVDGSSARRLQLIQQQLMARDNLTEIIEKFDLYGDAPNLLISQKVDLLRRSVTITGVAAVREGFADDGTISVLTFTASMDSAEKAQGVAHEFADRTRDLSTQQRKEQTLETLEFFQRQEDILTLDVSALEDGMTAFRRENDLSLEGSLDLRQSELASLNDSILNLDREIIASELSLGQVDRSSRAATILRLEEGINGELETLTTQRKLLNQRRISLTASIETTPEIDAQIARFNRRMIQLQGQLDVASTRRNEAEVGFSLESASRGERLTTIEEAPLPDYPISTSRKKRAAMGGIASGLLALVVAFILDLRKPVIRTAKQMERETGLRPVISIGEMRLPKKPRGLRKIWAKSGPQALAGREARRARVEEPNTQQTN